ncbi:hypothetical protein EV650_5198 [Kribbella kalugense]|uniref:Uncharacterized protein n=1 Tax=Kribbella kalugense TaxID=2512221 RepID=A0A4R7ZMF2_9ACTN|nr:hypothetical protein EV650_5198 [Kribbella kalugense]
MVAVAVRRVVTVEAPLAGPVVVRRVAAVVDTGRAEAVREQVVPMRAFRARAVPAVLVQADSARLGRE